MLLQKEVQAACEEQAAAEACDRILEQKDAKGTDHFATLA